MVMLRRAQALSLAVTCLLAITASCSASCGDPHSKVAQCVPIDSKLPSGCPEKIGPPCPRCYTNPIPDFEPGMRVELCDACVEKLRMRYQQYSDIMDNLQINSTTVKDASVYLGAAGQALRHYKKYIRTGSDVALNDTLKFLDVTQKMLPALNRSDHLHGYSGFFWSHNGALAVEAVVYSNVAGMEQQAKDAAAEVQRNIAAQEGTYSDLLPGHAGLLFAGAFINQNVNKTVFPKQPISTKSMEDLAQRIVIDGQHGSTAEQVLSWRSAVDGDRWLGTTHGTAGILYNILDNAPGLLTKNTTAAELIFKAYDNIVAHQFPTGNFPTEYCDPDEDQLVQWDHGGPGVSMSLFKAGHALEDLQKDLRARVASSEIDLESDESVRRLLNRKPSTYLDSAAKAQDDVWRRGFLTKGLMNCHGISGNIYSVFHAYDATANRTYLYRGLRMVEFVLNNTKLSDPAEMRHGTPDGVDYYLWPGSYASSLYLWTDILFGKDGLVPRMTGFVTDI